MKYRRLTLLNICYAVDLLTQAVTRFISNLGGLGFNPRFPLCAISDEGSDNGEGFCPSSFGFPLLVTIPPLIHYRLSPYDSLDQASRHYILSVHL
jgi:hypothetical protein